MTYDGDGHYAAYESNLKELRNWLLAYGVGAPVLIISNDAIYSKVANSGASHLIVIAFAVGVAFQVFITALNKWNNWCLYRLYEPDKTPEDQSWFVKRCAWLSDKIIIDIACDTASIILLGIATVTTLLLIL